ncbi:hypothetical protein [Leeia sp.]|uniref:hypothetical protein n=1 Tax=Leeia sp. TaxID=2884678 RepID=UPI0035B309A9
MNRIIPLLCLLLAACQDQGTNPTPPASTADVVLPVPQHRVTDDFLLTAEARQIESLGGIRSIVIRCHCAEQDIIRDDQASGLVLDMSGQQGSQGYHGEQSVPGQMQPRDLLFDRSVRGDTLTLHSREWLYVHHFSQITRLQVRLPSRITLRFEPLSEEELYQHSPFKAR